MSKFECLACRAKEKIDIYNFGEIPLVNAFDVSKEVANAKYPLSIVICKACKVCQLEEVPSPKIIFTNYKHFSSASNDNIKHLNSVGMLLDQLLEPQSRILEVGCNDGTLLHILDNKGHKVLGIDPAKNMSSIEIHVKLNTVFENYGRGVIDKLISLNNNEKFDCVVGLNVFAHFSSVLEAFQATKEIIKPDGIFVFEVAYALDTLFSGIYDTAYHEHVFNHTMTGLENMLTMANFKIIGANKVGTQGGSIRIFSAKEESNKHFDILFNQYDELVNHEKELGLGSNEFSEKTHETIKKSLSKIKEKTDEFLKKPEESCFLIGAPARGVVIANTCNFSKYENLIPIDDTSDKYGKYFPGLSLKVGNWKQVEVNMHVKKAILLSWNYKETMITKLKQSGFKGELLCYFPTIEHIVI